MRKTKLWVAVLSVAACSVEQVPQGSVLTCSPNTRRTFSFVILATSSGVVL